MKSDLKNASTYHLIIELMYHGKAEIIDETASLEPIGVEEIVDVLKKRSNADYGEDFDAWFDWFMKTKGTATEEEKENLKVMKTFKEQNEYYAKKIAKKRGTGDDNQSP